jgi:exosortase E/protease (VPEID-CTERM system)
VHENPSRERLPIARWIGLFALLAVEVLAVTLVYDSGEVHNDRGWWREILWYSPDLLRLFIVVASATLLIAGKALWAELREASIEIAAAKRWLLFLPVQLASYASFVLVTSIVLGGDIRLYAFPGILVTVWMLTGGLTLASVAAMALPISVCWRLLRRFWWAFLTATALGIVVLGAGHLSEQVWLPLGRTTFNCVSFVLGPMIPRATFDASEFTISTGSYTAIIVPGCSGYQGIGLIIAFLGIYLWLFRAHLRFPHALLVLPVGILVSWVLNVCRLVALILIGTYVSPAIADGGFHSQAGWLAFNAIGLGLVALTHRSRFFLADQTEAVDVDNANPSAAYLVPFLVLVATVMVTMALNPGFDYLYPLRFLTVGLALVCFTREYARWSWRWSWEAAGAGAAVFALWLALEPAVDPEANVKFKAALDELPEGAALGWLIFRVLGSVVTVPLAEEIAFRGYLTRRLIGAEFDKIAPGTFTWFSFTVSSALFGMLHGRWLAGTLAGMLYALVLYRRGRTADAVLAHATTNALIAVYVLLTGAWTLWM